MHAMGLVRAAKSFPYADIAKFYSEKIPVYNFTMSRYGIRHPSEVQ